MIRQPPALPLVAPGGPGVNHAWREGISHSQKWVKVCSFLRAGRMGCAEEEGFFMEAWGGCNPKLGLLATAKIRGPSRAHTGWMGATGGNPGQVTARGVSLDVWPHMRPQILCSSLGGGGGVGVCDPN